MIAPHDHGDPNVREIARGLAAAIEGVLAAANEPAAVAWNAAHDVAELLQLEGLVALLEVCRVHALQPPADVSNALERLSRLATETAAQGTLAAFTDADRELGALAGLLSEQSWAVPPGEPAPPVSVQSLAELLADLEVDDRALLERCRLALPVAAGLRAALDWLGAGATGALRISLQDAVVTIGLRAEHEPGLAPAGAVLALTGGALLPAGDGRWAIRVPLHTDRPAYLLARQGGLALALPWHAVAQLRLATESARAGFAEPSLDPWSPLARATGERPAVLFAQGLQHAWLHLDHIVWRVFAAPEPAMGPDEMPGVRLCIYTSDGEAWWVVAPEEALRDVPPLVTPPTRPRQRDAQAAAPAAAAPEPVAAPHAPVVHETVMTVVSAPQVEFVEPSPRLAPAVPELLVLGRDHVRPLSHPRPTVPSFEPKVVVLEPTPVATLEPPVAPPAPPTPIVVTAAPAEPAPVRATRAPRRALIADDSLVARLAIARVLESQGWLVEMVERATDMWKALEEGGYGAVFVDVALPDARGREHLRELVARQLVTAERFELVALPRDTAEEQVVRECGIPRALRKPFAKGAIEALVGALRPADRA
ncbi:MAG: response regulator [Candidatus Eisenbacteria bacterium]|nr:response regulator [Candidatus Eisenbacteria bacterium]